MVMWRCLILAVGAALARGDARRKGNDQDTRRKGNDQDKLNAMTSALAKGDFSVLNDVEAVRDILDAGWEPNKQNVENGRTLLHITAWHGDPKVVLLLVEYGADVDLQDFPTPWAVGGGSTPLLLATWRNRSENVKAFLDSGASPNISGMDGLKSCTTNLDCDEGEICEGGSGRRKLRFGNIHDGCCRIADEL